MTGLHAVFYLATVLCIIAAVASLLRGQRYINDQIAQGAVGVGVNPTSGAATSIQEVSRPASPASPSVRREGK